jgi:hypothetical protein
VCTEGNRHRISLRQEPQRNRIAGGPYREDADDTTTLEAIRREFDDHAVEINRSGQDSAATEVLAADSQQQWCNSANSVSHGNSDSCYDILC